MPKRVVIIHTNIVTVELLKDVFSDVMPDGEITHILDEGIERELTSGGDITPRAVRRFCNLVMSADDLDAHAILSACTTISQAVGTAQQLTSIPLVRIDGPMVQKAVSTGKRIGIIATLQRAVKSTLRLAEDEVANRAKRTGTKAELCVDLCEGAYEALKDGDTKRHDTIVLESIRRMSSKVDVIMLAQASMCRIVAQTTALAGPPVLTSPRVAAEKVKEMIG